MQSSTTKENQPEKSPQPTRATVKGDYRDKFERLKWGCREKVISKTTTKKKIVVPPIMPMNKNRKNMIIDSLNGVERGTMMLASMCRCGYVATRLKDSAICPYCIKLEADPMTGLPKFIVIPFCPNCGKHYTPAVPGVRAPPQSAELLDLLIRMLERHLRNMKTKVVHFHYIHSEHVSKNSFKVSMTLQVETKAGEKLDRTCIVDYLVKFQQCRPCRLAGPFRPSNFVLQIRPYGRKDAQSVLKLEPRVIFLADTIPAVNLRKVGQGFDVYFLKVKHAQDFVDGIDNVAPVKPDNAHGELYQRCLIKNKNVNMNKNKNKNKNKSVNKKKEPKSQSCTTAYVCPLCTKDLVLLPSNLAESLGHFGPLVICVSVRYNVIHFVDPFTWRCDKMHAGQYWFKPFYPIKTQKELEVFVVLDVEIVPGEKRSFSSVANIEVARMSDLGLIETDLRFLVKSHLTSLKPGDYALGYMLRGANIADVGAEKCKYTFPDVVLVEKRKVDCEPTKKMEMEMENGSSEYNEFLRELQNNPEAIFNLTLNNDTENGSSDLSSSAGTGANVDLDVENFLSHLGLSD